MSYSLMKAQSPTAWVPVLTGDIYCSPACGFKCTKAAYDLAHEKAAELVRTMGTGWEVRVWENGSWHYLAAKGKAHIIFETSTGRYTAYFNTVQQVIVSGTDPKEVLKEVIRLARVQVEESLADIAAIEDDCK